MSNLESEQLCYICNEPCKPLAGDCSLWPVDLPYEGVMKPHHIGCVMETLRAVRKNNSKGQLNMASPDFLDAYHGVRKAMALALKEFEDGNIDKDDYIAVQYGLIKALDLIERE